jgi:hypothetical protein
LGKNITVSTSAVSSLRKDADGLLEQVQVNGGMNPGNSGGPVVDAAGRVVGVAVAGIPGTQINFAVPGDKVLGLVNGRLSEISIGEAQKKNNQIVVPVELGTLDPLRRLKKLSVDWWFAPPGPPRPPSREKPTAQPGETRRTVSVEYQAAGNTGTAELMLPGLPPAGQVLWVQPSLTDAAGQPRWAAALPKALEAPPEPTTVTLSRRVRTAMNALDLTSTSTLRLRAKGGEQHTLRINIVTKLQEAMQQADATGASLARLGVRRFEVGFNVDNQSPSLSPRMQRAVQSVGLLGLDLWIDRAGNIARSQTDVSQAPQDVQATLERFAKQMRESLDVAAVPLPGQTRPNQTWKARRLLPVVTGGDAYQLGSVDMTYTYLGVRTVNGKEHAVVSLKGIVRNAGEKLLSGQAKGTALVEVATGRVAQATVTVEVSLDLDFEGETVNAKGTLEVRLARAASGA